MVDMPDVHRSGPHWSASRFMLFEQCPKLYKDRYVDGLATPASLPMLFGSAVHTALEALHQGHSQTCLPRCGIDHSEERYREARAVYAERFDDMSVRLAELGLVASASLYTEGLRMLNAVAELGLNVDARSEPERWFSLPTQSVWQFDTIGAVDLWSPPKSKHGPVVWDFKTTAGAWSEARAERERWQPLLYTRAYQQAYGLVPTFKYVVLNRVSGTLEIFDRKWHSRREWNDDLADLSFHAEEIAEAVRDRNFTCTRGHGTCLECGKPYGHDHVCDAASRPVKIHLVRKHGQTWLQPELDLV